MASVAFWALQSDLARLLMQTGWVARVVLLILLGFSILSWAVIYRKYTAFRLARAQTERFLENFRGSPRLPDARPLANAFAASPLARLYAAAMKEVEGPRGADGKNPQPPADTAAVTAALQVASAGEIAQLERWMGFLATTGSVTPFIGLFGTVWGIIDAFMGLGESGATTLRAVAPGIAEALIATAAGLFAAIPAVIAYNYFLHQVRRFATRMENFTLEFLTRVEKTGA